MTKIRITDAQIAQAIGVLQRYHAGEMAHAREELSRLWGFDVGEGTLCHAFLHRELDPPLTYMLPRRTAAQRIAASLAGDDARAGRVGDPRGVQDRGGIGAADALIGAIAPGKYRRGDTVIDEPIAPKFTGREQAGEAERLAALLKATKRPVSFARLCDVLDLSPSKVRLLVEDARAKGYTIGVAGDEIGWKEPEPEVDAVSNVLPATSGRTIVGVISDTHFGSRYCLRKQIQDFIHLAYDAGARIILHAGDIVDGVYDHGRWELSHHGLEDQIQDALDTLPQLDGLRYIAITGNHDETFWKLTGYDTGRAINEAARGAGRSDIECVGARGAMLRVAGAKVELWHPKKGGAYALSYHLQNKIRDTGLGHKPDILLAGHWHTSVYLEQRGVHALACGTFQGGGSAFSKSLGGAPSIGGTLLSWETTEHGTLRRVAVERVAYYEQEAPREVA